MGASAKRCKAVIRPRCIVSTSGRHLDVVLREHELAESSVQLEHVRARPKADHHNLRNATHTHGG